jgi:uncharacterized protein (TIGR00299 family) protein
MILAALLDAGVPARVVRGALAGLDLPLRMRVSRVRRGALACRYVSFSSGERRRPQRRLRTIRALLSRSSLSRPVAERAGRVFARLAEAEGRVHGIPAERVHFHEVGAADAIGDIVSVCAALDWLGARPVTASPLPLGTGTVETEHGTLPLPAPATLDLLRGIPTYPAGIEWETVTPTGAALLATLADGFGELPAMTPRSLGYGAGEQREGGVPNALRCVIGEPDTGLATDVVRVIETNLDDMSPEHLPFLLESLLEAGALDASLSPLAMKKGRPGQLLRVIAEPEKADALARLVLLESTALGVRVHTAPRLKLARESRQVETPYGRIAVKAARAPDGRWVVSPEYEACARAARRSGAPLREVWRAAERAAEETLA